MKPLINFLLFNLLTLCTNQASAVPSTLVSSQHTMVVSEQALATQIGNQILQEGGNAIDAAVAMGYALAVVQPCCGNLGGGGFMIIHLANGKDTFFNFREKAPLAATPHMYLDKNGHVIPNLTMKGYLAVGTPGTVLGLNTALAKYGTLPLKKLIAPAIELAESGFILKQADAKHLSKANIVAAFQQQPNVAAIFLNNGKPYQAGNKFIQHNLANTLKLIANGGSDIFYKGIIANKIVKASKQHGGILSKQDFLNYTVEELQPVYCKYRSYTIISAPPPSSGGITLCEMLNILEGYPLTKFGFHTAQSVHYISEAMRFAFYDRNKYLGDPNFINMPLAKLLAKDYAAKIRNQISYFKATTSLNHLQTNNVSQSTYTTHYSVIDKQGNAVAVTYTIDNYFGARVIAGDTGFFLNNEMDDFTTKVGISNQFGLFQGFNNSISPGKRPLSSMTPTIVIKDKQVFMILGSPGGSTIITSILQTLINIIDYRMDIQTAVNAPRFHQQWLPDRILLEPHALSFFARFKLKLMGYNFVDRDETWGAVEAILIDPKTQIHYGANDIRRPGGLALGY